jgi:predicted SnoaL-like aldol condensation-catalyzing enzyme
MTFRRHLLPITALLCALSAGAAVAQTPSAARDLTQEEANRTLVLSFYERFFNQHQTEEASKLMVEEYRQHNPHVPDGKAPMVGWFSEYFKKNPQAQAKVVRSATDGDLVYLHVHFTSGPTDRGQALVDIFRVKDGRIVEHWDVIQQVPEHAANDNSMF